MSGRGRGSKKRKAPLPTDRQTRSRTESTFSSSSSTTDQLNMAGQDVNMDDPSNPNTFYTGLPEDDTTVPARVHLSGVSRANMPGAGQFSDIIDFMTSAFSENRSQALIDACFDQEFIADIQYQGFDVIATRHVVVSRLASFCNNDRKQISCAIMRLVLLYIHRGNNVTGILATIGEEAKSYYGPILRAIPVHSKLQRTNLKTCVTLARLCLCFPEVAFDVAETTGAQDVTGIAVMSQIPASMRVNSFPALCKQTNNPAKDVIIVNALKAHVVYQAYASKVYAKQPLTLTKEDILKQKGFAEITLRNSAVSTTRQDKAFFTGALKLCTEVRDPDSGTARYVFLNPDVQGAVDLYNTYAL